jgi:hypothetical protein
MRENPGHPYPCSAKAVYRLADSKKAFVLSLDLEVKADMFVVELGLVELKARAFEASVPTSI